MIYNKATTTIQQQIHQLEVRGLAIADEGLAAHYLSNISYYRLAGYWWPMQVGRLWNINLPGRPHLLPKPPAPWLNNVPPVNQHHMLYIHACCMKYLLDVVSPGHHYKIRLADLFIKYPNVDLNAVGFPADWQNEPLWRSISYAGQAA